MQYTYIISYVTLTVVKVNNSNPFVIPSIIHNMTYMKGLHYCSFSNLPYLLRLCYLTWIKATLKRVGWENIARKEKVYADAVKKVKTLLCGIYLSIS